MVLCYYNLENQSTSGQQFSNNDSINTNCIIIANTYVTCLPPL